MGIDSVKDSVEAGLSSAVSSASAPFTTLATTPEDAGDGAPSAGALGAWAASLALKGIEKVREKAAAISSHKADPAKIYEEVRAHLEEGNLPAAKRKMMLFKKWTEGTADPELLKMREEIRAVLRELNLAAVEELKKANEALLEQRLAHLDLLTPHFVSKMKAEKNGRALDLLANLIKKGAVDTVEEGLKIVKPLMADDPDLMWLVELETGKGLRDIDTPEKMRKRDLETAKELRHRDGSYLIAEGKLKTVLEDEIKEALESITPDEEKKIAKEIRYNAHISKRVSDKAITEIKKLKEEDPQKFKADYPESDRRGYLVLDEVKRKEDESFALLAEAGKEKAAFRRIKERYEAGKIIDPVAREAWLTLDRMKDPTDDWLEMSDESWDRVIDDAVVMAVTGVVTGGVGSLARFGMGALTRSLVARGGAWALAARGATFAGATAAESLAMEGVNYAFTKEFDPKNLAFNALTSWIFHGGPALTRGLGFADDLAEGAASKAKNLAGTLSVQTLLDTGVGYLHDATIGHGDERTLWERLFQGALRMGGFHAVGALTGHATTRMEIPTKVRDKAAGSHTEVLPVAARREITLVGGYPPKKTSLERTFETPITEAEFDSMFREPETTSPAAGKLPPPPPGSAMAPHVAAWDLYGGRNLTSPETIVADRKAAFDKASDKKARAAVNAAVVKGDIAPATWQGYQGDVSDCVFHALANMSNGRFTLKDVKDVAVRAGIDPSKGMYEPELKRVLAELEILSAAEGTPVVFQTYPSHEFFKIAGKKYRSEGTRPAGLAILRVDATDSHAVVVRGQTFIKGHPVIVVTDSHTHEPPLYTPESFAAALLSDGIITVADVKR